MTTSEPPMQDQNEYFSNFEYKLKDAIKFPDFDIIKEMTLNVSRDQTPISDQRTVLNLEMTNELSGSQSALPTQTEQQDFTNIHTSTNLSSMFESWNNTLEQSESLDIQEQFSQNGFVLTSQPVTTYDVIYLGDDIYANDNINDSSTKEAETTCDLQSKETMSVLRNRLLNTPDTKKEAELEHSTVRIFKHTMHFLSLCVIYYHYFPSIT